LNTPFRNASLIETDDEEDLDESRSEPDTSAENADRDKMIHIELKGPPSSIQQLNALLVSTASFVVKTCFLFGFLIKFLAHNESLSGHLFLIVTLVVLMCDVYYFPAFRLTTEGYIHYKVMKWVLSILAVSVFLYLLRSCKHTNSAFL
jgi:hypothetical protein